MSKKHSRATKGNNTGNTTKQLLAYSGSMEFPVDLQQQTSVQNHGVRRHVRAFFRSTINAACVRTNQVKAFVFSVLYVASHIASHCGVVFGSLLSARRVCVCVCEF